MQIYGEENRRINERIWASQRAVTGEGETNPFEIFRQRGEYIDRTQNGGGLEPWEFGYQEPTSEPGFLERLRLGSEQYRRSREASGPSLGRLQNPELGGEEAAGPFGVQWGEFFLRAIYIAIGIILLGIGSAALATQAENNPVSRTIRQAQRFVS